MVYTPKGKEKRVDIEAMSLKEGSAESGNKLLRVNGDAQLANSMTKGHEPWQLRLFFNTGCRWRLVYDERFQSARKRKAAGLAPLADNNSSGLISVMAHGDISSDDDYYGE